VTEGLVGSAALLLLVAIAMAAYHRGQRHGRVRMPARLIADLRHHKVHCVGEPEARVALEIGLLCETDTSTDGSRDRASPA
jgi:hypothetical protein